MSDVHGIISGTITTSAAMNNNNGVEVNLLNGSEEV
jgi:hypothetical protein